VYAEFGTVQDAARGVVDLELNRSLQALAVAVRARELPWMRDVVPALCGIALHIDPFHPELPDPILDACRVLLEECFDAAGKYEDSGRTVVVPVCYEPAFALDLDEVVAATKQPAKDIARLHAGSKHLVLMVGFSPGQPYIGGSDPKLFLPRRATPRTRMPAGAVAIAIGQTCVYPYETPGGWSIIGRTPLTVFDPKREPASLFAPGDRVRFEPISADDYERLK
jgi:inhibitor of KinA